MRRRSLLLAVLACLPGALSAQQDLTGTWQGTLQVGRELRTVIKVTKSDAGLKAQFFSIDQGGQPLSASSVTLKDGTVAIALPAIGGTYDGKLSPDGNSITGTFTQGPKPVPLNLTRATPQSEWTIPEPPKPLKPMAADADPTFEVATIKPSDPNRMGRGFRIQPGQFSTFNTSLKSIITFAYNLQNNQVIGGPAWLTSDQFDIVVRPDGQGQPNEEQWKTVLKKLLKDRFKLTFHDDSKELSVYVITVAKGGPKLTVSQAAPESGTGVFFGALGQLSARNARILDFARTMQNAALDRPILDQTGLTGRYDFTLKWVPDEFQFADIRAPGEPPIPSITDGVELFTAIQQQLGLKLDATKAPAPVMVIDRAEKPSEN